MRITDLPKSPDYVRFKPQFGQRFLLTVDTEEEFDWAKPLAREEHTVLTVARLAKFQEFCEGQGVVPVYLVDYPIATSPAAFEILRPSIAAGKAEVGVQLHPWSAHRTTKRSISTTASPEIFRRRWSGPNFAICAIRSQKILVPPR